MKPYFKVLYNKIKLLLIKMFRCSGLTAQGIQLFGYDTRMVFSKTSKIFFGDRIISDGKCTIIADEHAIINIGKNVYFNEDMMISSKSSVVIGDGCQFGPNVKIFDNNHKFDAEHGVLPEHTSGNIIIGNNCWIASNVTILKDTVIGDKCVIGAGCVVKGVIPDGSIVTQDRKLNIKPIKNNL